MKNFAIEYFNSEGESLCGCYVEADTAFESIPIAHNVFYPVEAVRMVVMDEDTTPLTIVLDIAIS